MRVFWSDEDLTPVPTRSSTPRYQPSSRVLQQTPKAKWMRAYRQRQRDEREQSCHSSSRRVR